MKHFITVVGMDVHKDSIEIVIAETTGTQEVRHYGKINGDMASLDKAVRKLKSTSRELHFVYEAGHAAMRFTVTYPRRGLLVWSLLLRRLPDGAVTESKTIVAMLKHWPDFIGPGS